MNELLSPYCAPSCTLQRPDCGEHGMEGDVPCAIAAQVTAISWPPEQSCGCFPNCGSHRLEKPKAVFKCVAVLILSMDQI